MSFSLSNCVTAVFYFLFSYSNSTILCISSLFVGMCEFFIQGCASLMVIYCNSFFLLFKFNFERLNKNQLIQTTMFLDISRKSLNTCLRFLHLGLQIIAAYWAVVIDGYPCQENFIRNVTYFAYALIGFNLIFSLYFGNRVSDSKFLYYLPFIVNLGLSAGILYFTIEGYNKYNTCAQSRVLYELFFIETVIALVIFILVMAGKIAWADRYAHWPGNLAWPILFLKTGFPGVLRIPAIVIGAVYAFISVASFFLNAFYYNTLDIDGSKTRALSSQWTLSMVLMFAAEVLAIVMLVMNGNDGEFGWQYARKIFVVFAAVNIVDFFFWFYGYKRLSAWATSP